MNRRHLIRQLAVPIVGAVASFPRIQLGATPPVAPATERTPVLAEYERLHFGVSYHFSMNTFTDNDYEPGNVPASTYNPTHLDVRQWIRVARDLGAKYAILTAKHMSGFCLWHSKGYDYDVAASGNKTDVVAAFVAACKEYGLRPGFYYCILDPHNEGKLDWSGIISDQYFRLVEKHITELHTQYPGTFYQLFDIPTKLTSEQRWALYRLVKKYSPDCLVVMNQEFDQSRRNQGRICEPASWPTDVINGEDTLPPPEGHNPHIKVESKEYYLPFETWLPSGPNYKPQPRMHTWFWHPWYKTQDAAVLVDAYRACMTRGANLVLNLAPDNTGRLTDEAVQTLQEVAEKIRNLGVVRSAS
ncbi:MAG TPA: alpha-L-fucosidase [Terriglobia bacterium]|nr:alpha-L-fucosidase [Terriglobia bacterium]